MRIKSTPASRGLGEGWETARRNFGDDVWFFAPSLKRYSTERFRQSCNCYFRPVSITGSRCALMCDHCRASILKDMRPALTPDELLATAAELYAAGARGILVSGGSDAQGVVPLAGFLGTIVEIRERLGLKVLVHTGITDKKLARGLAFAGVDAALIDIIGDSKTIKEICHLENTSTADYEHSLANLVDAGVPAAPHVIIGLHRGAMKGEANALSIISRHQVSSLVLVGLTPRPDTPMDGMKPPSPGEMGRLFHLARELMPKTPILLGCERPWGEHKEQTDRLALEAGLNGIAYPSEGIIGYAEKMGLKPKLSEMCCALMFENLTGDSR